MGEFSEWYHVDAEDIKGFVELNGVSGLKEFCIKRLENWKDVEINVAITGDSGSGKSSFINAIRGLHEDDEKAAPVGVKQTTIEPSCYDHPANPKIKFWDLPGVGTPNYPKKTYWKKAKLGRYDTFLIFSMCRFTENDKMLASEITSEDKKSFFIRTKIDQDIKNEKRKKSFNEGMVLDEILSDCFQNLKPLLKSQDDIFLIDNHDPTKWDFARLTQAILDVLPARQRESLTLTLDVLTRTSTDILQRKVEVLRGRIWKVATASAVGGMIPIPGLSFAFDFVLVTNEISLYRSQLGLPKIDSAEFFKLNHDMQESLRKFCLTTVTQISGFVAAYASQSALEEASRYIPLVGFAIAGSMSFGFTYYLLHRCLDALEKTALAVMED